MKLLMTLAEAASETPYGPKVLRQAVHATDPESFPPPLKAKKGSRGEFLVTSRDLVAWVDSLKDA